MSSGGDSHHAQWMCVGRWRLPGSTISFGVRGGPLPPRDVSLDGHGAAELPRVWQCIGMLVGVYGVGYLVAASDPIWHWPIVLVGLLGKVLGPVGFIRAAILGDLPWVMGWTIVFNDLIWWVPFAIILWKAWEVG